MAQTALYLLDHVIPVRQCAGAPVGAVIANLVARPASNTHPINVVGAQRSLSQRLALMAPDLSAATDAVGRAAILVSNSMAAGAACWAAAKAPAMTPGLYCGPFSQATAK